MVGSRRPKEQLLLLLVAAVMAAAAVVERGEAATWCIARSGANATAMQTALDYACGTGVADCVPVQASGLCYLPNTLAAHASYAFNSFYQRSNAAPGACDFAGTATVTITDPSYGSCTYPSSASTAGGTTPTPGTGTPTTPITGVPMTPMAPPFSSTGGGGLGGLSPPNFGTTLPDSAPVSVSPLVSILPSICFGLLVLLLG